MNYSDLKAEITDDPLGVGYSSMSDEEIATSLNSKDRSVDRESIAVDELFDALDLTEFSGLTANEEARVDRILSMGGEVRPQGNVKTELASIFGAGTATRAAILAAIKESISRAAELNFREIAVSDVVFAKTGGY